MFGAITLVAGGAAYAQPYPNKLIRLVTSGTGSGGDVVSRIVAHEMSPAVGQPIIVANRPSALIGGEIVAKAPPDGYTLYLQGSTLWVTPLLQKAPYDVFRDFAPITLVYTTPLVLVVHPSLPVT